MTEEVKESKKEKENKSYKSFLSDLVKNNTKENVEVKKIKFKGEYEKRETVILTDEQKLKILERWNDITKDPPSIQELLNLIFSGVKDGRSPESIAIKKFLSEQNIVVKSASHDKRDLVLTQEQKEYISNNCENMNSVEMTAELFNMRPVPPNCLEHRKVKQYLESLPSNIKTVGDQSNIPDGIYIAPKTINKAVRRINRYIDSGIPESEDKMGSKVKEQMFKFIGYLNNYRLVHQMNGYKKITDRELCESSFISYVYNKPDLEPEELDQYIVLSNEVVISSNILVHIQTLENLLTTETEQEDPKIRLGLVEAIADARKEYNSSVKRQQDLISDLTGKRSQRLNMKSKDTASVSNLVDMWREAESRKRLLEQAEKLRKTVNNELKKIETMDDIVAEIYGVNKDDFIL